MAIKIDVFHSSLNKYGEDLCGDQCKIIQNESGLTAVLVDGMSCGTKAGLMTSFAVNMISTILSNGLTIEQTADMAVASQSEAQSDSTDPIAFTLIQAQFDGTIHVERFNTPDVILFHRDKPIQMDMRCRSLHGKTILSGEIEAKRADTVIAVSKGMLTAGADRNLKSGWNLKTISAYMENAYNPKASAEKLVRLLLAAGNSLSFGRPKNDLSVLAIRLRE